MTESKPLSAAYYVDRLRSYGANPRGRQVLRDLMNGAADAITSIQAENAVLLDAIKRIEKTARSGNYDGEHADCSFCGAISGLYMTDLKHEDDCPIIDLINLATNPTSAGSALLKRLEDAEERVRDLEAARRVEARMPGTVEVCRRWRSNNCADNHSQSGSDYSVCNYADCPLRSQEKK